MSRHALLAWFLGLFLAFVCDAEIIKKVLLTYDLELNGEPLSAFVVLPTRNVRAAFGLVDNLEAQLFRIKPLDNLTASVSAIRYLTEVAEDEVIRRYGEAALQRGSTFPSLMEAHLRTFETMKKRDSTGFVMITGRNDLHDLRGFLRVDPADPTMPFQKTAVANGLADPVPPPKIEWREDLLEPLFHVRRSRIEQGPVPVISPWWTGAHAELKMFVASKGFAPLVTYLAEIHRLTRWGGIELPDEFRKVDGNFLRRLWRRGINFFTGAIPFQIVAAPTYPADVWRADHPVPTPTAPISREFIANVMRDGYVVNRISPDHTVGVRIGEYWGECTEELLPHYQLLGYEVVDSYPNPFAGKGKIYVLHMSRDRFEKHWLAHYFGSPSAKAIESLQLTYRPNWIRRVLVRSCEFLFNRLRP